MCSKSRIIVSIEATLRAFSLASNRLSRSAVSRGFIVRYPQPVRTGDFSGLRVPKCCQTVADNQLSKRHARQFPPPTVLLPTPAGPTAGAEVFTGTSLVLSNFI